MSFVIVLAAPSSTKNAIHFLLDCPRPWRIFSIAITNNCVEGKEMPRTNIQSKHIHGKSPGDRGYGQTAFEILISKTKYSHCRTSYFGLSIVFVLHIRVPTQKTMICNTVLSIGASPRTIDFKASPQFNPMMSQEPERKTNRHAHSTRDHQTKPNRVYEPVFQKEEKRGRFSNRP